MKYRADIDGLRCVAIVLVCLFHFDLVPGMKGGFVGVDIFFVISGFLISSLVWTQLEDGRFRLSNFYVRRFRRLAPALICVQLLLLIFGGLFLLPQELTDLAKQSLATQLYVVNFYFWRKVNYFGLTAGSVALLHCWSLAVEEQFYFLYPPFLMLVHRYARRHLGRLLALLAAVSFLLNIVLAPRKPEITFYLLPTRAWELALGALLPFAQPRFANGKARRLVSGLVGVGLVAASALTYHPGIRFPGTFALLPTLGTAALLLAGTGAGSPVSRFLGAPPFVFIGRISYSLYLVHWPLKVLVPIFLLDYRPSLRWASFAFAVVLAALLYRFVEDPIRRGRLFAGTRRFVGAYALGCAVVLVVLGSAIGSGGWTHRFGGPVQKIAAYAGDQDESTRVCEDWAGGAADEPCHLGAARATPSWVVFGDSHAWALAHAFSLFLEPQGKAGVLTFTHGCMPVLGLGDRKCQRYTDEVEKWIAASTSIRDVALVSIWRQAIEDGLEGPHHEYLQGDEKLTMFKQQFRETLQRLRAAGKNVYVWEPLAPARKTVPFTLARNLAFGWHLDIETPRSEHERLFGFFADALAGNRDLLSGTISPSSTMCRSGSCEVSDDDGPLFFDNNHPARSRAAFYSRIIESGIGASAASASSRQGP